MLHQQQTTSALNANSSSMALGRGVKPCITGLCNKIGPFLPQRLWQQQQQPLAHSNSSSRVTARPPAAVTAAAAATTTAETPSSSSSDVTHSKRVGVSGQTWGGGVEGCSGKTLMIVESPTKATKIQKFLGEDYKVLASYGHVRDLAAKNGSVNPEQGFSLLWQMTKSGEAKLSEMAAASAGCRALLLATDPDREGEAISWHITEELKRRGVLPRPGLTLQRITFNEVTQKAVEQALRQPRQVSQDLVDAYLARRALDYLVGFNLSPLLWRKLGRAARSAGRVQSVALRLVCDRESERQLFTAQEYWSISANFSTDLDGSSSSTLPARLVQIDGLKLQTVSLTTQQQAETVVQRLWQQQDVAAAAAGVLYKVTSVIRKPVKRSPSPPLVTSTLQQEASRRLGWSGSKTMQVAQQLYEGANTGEGLITYMRTDGVNISAEAVETLRDVIASKYGREYLPPPGSRVYKSRAKNAQEAHEAIRPTNPSLLPGQLQGLTPDQAKLYAIVWSRAVASQMESAELEQITAEITSPCGTLILRSSGSSMTFPGYLAAWGDQGVINSVTDNIADVTSGGEAAAAEATLDMDDLDGGSRSAADPGDRLSPMLQQLQEGQRVALVGVLPAQHFTKPPPRFTEATMVKTLEEAGVGRPSTYASIIRLLQERGYVVKSGRSLVPTPLGRLMTAYLTLFFSKYVDVNFTAQVEEQLDEVSGGSLAWRQLLAAFHTPLQDDIAAANAVSTRQVYEQLEQQLEQLIFQPVQAAAETAATEQADTTAAAADPRVCPACGGRLVLKPNHYTGGFIGCSNHDTQGCTFSRPLWPDEDEQLLLSDEETEITAGELGVIGSKKLLGVEPESGRSVWVKRGPFGLYLQLGDDPGAAAAAAASNIDSSSSTDGSSSSKARPRSQLPSSEPAPSRAALPKGISWSSITLEQALQQLALPRVVGLHPDSGEPVSANLGRFGPYLSHKTLSCALPKGLALLDVTLEQAMEAIGKKEQRLRARGQDPYEVKESRKTKLGRTSKDKSSSSSSSGSSTSSSSSGTSKKQANDSSNSRSSNTSGSSSSKPKALSGYNLFAKEMKDSIAAAAAAGTNRLSLIAQAWKGLPADEQEQYKQRAKEMSAAAAAVAAEASSSSSIDSSSSSGAASSSNGRREQSANARSRNRTSTNSSRSDSSSNSGDSSSSTSSSSSSSRSERSSSRRGGSSSSSNGGSSSSRRRPSSLRALSGYQYFCQQQRSAVAAAHPVASFGEISALLGAAWNDLDQQQKQHWADQATAAAAAAAAAAVS